jgi:hypothetical protein
MAESSSSPVPEVSTFVVRFWREWSAVEPHWRGRIEHVLSGDNLAFIDLDQMLEFLRRFGVMAEDESVGAKQEQ